MDQRYRGAVRLASEEPDEMRTAVAVEHISRLRLLGHSDRALARCEDRPRDRADDALLSRLEGLAAANHGWLSGALQFLRTARNSFATLGDKQAVAVVDDDIRAVTARRGAAVPESLASAPVTTPAARLARSEELRVVGRYEQALSELTPALEESLDPAVRFFFFGRLAEGERCLLGEPAPAEPDTRHAAEWHLAAGELTLMIATGTVRRDSPGRPPATSRKAHGTPAWTRSFPSAWRCGGCWGTRTPRSARPIAQRAEDGDPASGAHPSCWAPWTLYGDSGYQTPRGPVRRWLSRLPKPNRMSSGEQR